jgi:O-methyltransferase involved in polyketide biosynthesis
LGVDDRAAAEDGLDTVDRGTLPVEIDPAKPSIARVYDFVLGGKEHFAVDRRVSEALFAAVPEMTQLARESRAMLSRAVRWLVGEAGIRQIVDLGSGLPTEGNVHEVAHQIDPDVSVVYVDIDPIVLAHGRALLADDRRTTVIQADVRRPETVLDHPDLRAVLDLDRPFAVIAAGILHHFDDETATRTAAAVRARLSPGSYVVITNFVDDDEPRARELENAFLRGGLGTGRFRTWAEHRAFFEGLEMVEPGLVYANDWRPDEQTDEHSLTHTLYAGGIGRKPA